MSYQSGFQNPKNYGGANSMEPGVPESLVSALDQKMIPSTTTIKQITTQSGDQKSGGQMLFQIPTGSGQGYLKSGSAYLKCTITFTQAANAANISGFQGGLSVGAPTAFATASNGGGSASAIINRMNVSCGGVLMNSIQNYNVLHDVILNHCTSTAYRDNDSAMMEFTGLQLNGVAANSSLTVCIPIMVPCMNDEQSLPLFLLNSPIVIEVLFNSAINAVAYFTSAIAEYTVSAASIVYENLNVSSDFEMAVKMKLQQGAVWSMSTDDFYNLSLANLGVINYNIGLNLSSVKGVMWTTLATRVAGEYTGYTGDAQLDAKLYLDGRLINQFGDLTDLSQQYIEFQRTIGSMYDYVTNSVITRRMAIGAVDLNNPNLGTVLPATIGGYYTSTAYCGGIACNRSSDSGFAFTGTPCQTINFTRRSTGVVGTLYLMVMYSQMLMIDASGSVSIVR
jgi:hypothetical protein